MRQGNGEDAALAGGVFIEQIAALYRQRFDLIANLVVSTLAAAILSRLYPAWVGAAWIAAFWLAILLRGANRYRFLGMFPDIEAARRCARVYLIGTFVTASLWGLLGSVVLVTHDPLYYVLVVFLLGGMMAGGIVANAAYLPAMLTFIVPTILPTIVLLFAARNAAAVEMGGMLTIFALVLTGSGKNINQTILESLRLRVRQEILIVDLRASEASMAEAQRLAHVGGLELDVAKNEISFTAETYRILGEDPATFEPTVEKLMASVHPDDRPEVQETLEEFTRTGISRDIEYRIVMHDGAIKNLRSSGRKIEGLQGSKSRLFASVQDVTAQTKWAEELAYRDRLLDAVTAGTAILVRAESIELGMPEALRTLGESMHLDRIDVLQEGPALAETIASRYHWQRHDAPIPSDAGTAMAPTSGPATLGEIRAQLTAGKIVVGHRATAEIGMPSILHELHFESFLLVPIFNEHALWGGFGAGTFREARVWTANEINTLRTFASIVGSLVVRDEARRSLEVSERRLRVSSAQLEFANMLLKTEMEASPDAMFVVDGERKILSRNKRFADMWGLEPAPLGSIHDAKSVASFGTALKDSRKYAERVEHLYAHPEEDGDDELEFADGRFFDRRTASLKGPSGEYLGRVWYFRDITERKEAESLAIRMAHYDVLTGLANRMVFVDAVAQSIAHAKRGKAGFAVLYLDLDHFKDVNDTLGHPVGDELLQAVAGRLNANMRAGDIVARFGGDEFAVLVSDVSDPGVAGFVADKLIKALSQPFSIEGNEIRTGASIGIDLYGPGCTQAETLLSHADVALYRAKSEGRNSYRFFTDAMDREVRTRVMLGAELRGAVSGGQLFLMYQPQVASATGQIIGLEALVRWNHPAHGVLGPVAFIPVAESTGTIVALGQWVLLHACRQAKAWLDAGIGPVRCSVNVSGLQFKMPLELEANITAALAETNLPAHLLEIELTETVLMEVSLEHSEALARLRRAGVTIAIDDFGTGYSSLAYLRRFPVDRIKIARDFVKDLATVPEHAAIIRATIGLARELGIALIAEGVETREQLDALKSWGCPEIQGFYFARPLSAKDVTLAFQHGGVIEPHPFTLA